MIWVRQESDIPGGHWVILEATHSGVTRYRDFNILVWWSYR